MEIASNSDNTDYIIVFTITTDHVWRVNPVSWEGSKIPWWHHEVCWSRDKNCGTCRPAEVRKPICSHAWLPAAVRENNRRSSPKSFLEEEKADVPCDPIVGSLRTQTYFRLSLVSGDKRQPEIGLRSQATWSGELGFLCNLCQTLWVLFCLWLSRTCFFDTSFKFPNIK